jgi:hypothetical protein
MKYLKTLVVILATTAAFAQASDTTAIAGKNAEVLFKLMVNNDAFEVGHQMGTTYVEGVTNAGSVTCLARPTDLPAGRQQETYTCSIQSY